MPPAFHVTTEQVEPAARFAYWHDAVCERFAKLDARRPATPESEFFGQMLGTDIGVIRLSTVTATSHEVLRTTRHIGEAASEDVLIDLPVSGPGVLVQDGRQAMLRPGDFALCDNTRPYTYGFPVPLEQVVLQFPRSLLFGRDPMFEHLTAVAVPGDRGIGRRVSQFLQSLAQVADWQDSPVTAQLGMNVIDLIATALADRLGDGARVSPRKYHLLNAKHFLVERLHEMDLSPTLAAEAIGISVRYLHALFRDEGVSVSQWILDRRLERSRALLEDANRMTLPVADIAYAVGFKDATHFSHVFKRHVGLSPREYRLAAAERSVGEEEPSRASPGGPGRPARRTGRPGPARGS